VKLAVNAVALENTTFGSTYRTRIGGFKNVALDLSGYWDSPADATNFADLGVMNRAVTVSPNGVETNTAYFLQAGRFKYDEFGKAGDMTPWMITGANSSSQGIIRGQLGKAKGNVSATGQLGSILTITGPSATQFLYASFHVFTVGTTITVLVESATTLGFAGPTTRATIGPITVAGGTWLTRVAGPITDGFYRFNVSAITGTFNVAGAIGVGS
jgi:hypothetical protein